MSEGLGVEGCAFEEVLWEEVPIVSWIYAFEEYALEGFFGVDYAGLGGDVLYVADVRGCF